MIPMPKEVIHKIKGAMVIPTGCATQLTINDKGQTVTKRRVTHDASFKQPSEISVNDLCNLDLLQPCKYGQCMLRILHGIHNLRLCHPNKTLFACKYDFDAAYMRLHEMP